MIDIQGPPGAVLCANTNSIKNDLGLSEDPSQFVMSVFSVLVLNKVHASDLNVSSQTLTQRVILLIFSVKVFMPLKNVEELQELPGKLLAYN